MKKIVPVKRLAENVGFMGLFKNTEMVFYVKNLKSKRNIGARVDSAGKVKIIQLINDVEGRAVYSSENTKSIAQVGLCIILEMIMRYKTEQGQVPVPAQALDSKVYYLLPEQAMLIKVREI